MIRKLHALLSACPPAGLVSVLLLLGACSSRSGPDPGQWRCERTIEGNITTVRTLSGSVWQGTARLVEEAVIGVEEGPDEYLLGKVEALTVGNDRIYLIDRVGPIIRAYDLEGNHLADIGRAGQGPGEYVRPRALAVHPVDGRLVVRDGRGHRINIYSPQGDYLTRWPYVTSVSYGYQIRFTDAGILLTPGILNPFDPIEEWRQALLGFGPEGATGDTIAIPSFSYDQPRVTSIEEGGGMNASAVPFAPDVVWNAGHNGIIAAGISERYRITLFFPDGRQLVVERDFEPVPIESEEKSWWRAQTTAGMRLAQPGWSWNGPPIPDHKPAFSNFVIDAGGRLWVKRPGQGRTHVDREPDPSRNPIDSFLNPYWSDTIVMDIFDFEGRYLGEVEVPEGFRLGIDVAEPHIRDEMVVACVDAPGGYPTVVRYRLQIDDRE
jgi:hypothetical protein